MSEGEIGVTVRTPAGMSRAFGIESVETSAGLVERSIGWFVGQGQLEPGAFRLGLLRGAHILDLAPDARLVDTGVVDGDVLHLLTNEPQIDGATPSEPAPKGGAVAPPLGAGSPTGRQRSRVGQQPGDE